MARTVATVNGHAPIRAARPETGNRVTVCTCHRPRVLPDRLDEHASDVPGERVGA